MNNDAGDHVENVKPSRTFASLLSNFQYHAYTVYLFTCDNHQIIIIPWTFAGLVDALSGSVLTTGTYSNVSKILARLPHSLLWMYLNILAFALANQRSATSVAEDRANKPWRPIPSGRLTAAQAQNFLLAVIPLVILITTLLGAVDITAFALVLNWLYNDLGGSDGHYTVRNMINALAMIVSSMGTAKVAMSHGAYHRDYNTIGYYWLATKAAIVFTTLQLQDLRDQEGDRERKRATAPIILGDAFTRWTIAVPVIVWSSICPWLWGATGWIFILSVLLGMLLSYRVLCLRDKMSDQASWSLWGIWTFVLFLLPLCK